MGHIQNGIFQPFWKFTLSIVEEHDEKNLVFQPIWKKKMEKQKSLTQQRLEDILSVDMKQHASAP